MSRIRIGHSIDIHNLVYAPNTYQKIGGCIFNTNYLIEAVSDGDVVLHAVSEAIIGALGLGDLGEHFSESNPKNSGLNSEKILNYAIDLLKTQGYRLVNLDLTIICEHIMFKDKKSEIKQYLISQLNCSNINVKATRYEDINNYQIACDATLLIESNF